MIQVAASGTQKIKIFLRVKGLFFIKGKLILQLREFKKSLIKIKNCHSRNKFFLSPLVMND